MDESPVWRPFQRLWSQSGRLAGLKFVEGDTSGHQRQNEAKVMDNQLVLKLFHFCVFAVVIDGREAQAKPASFEALTRICVSPKSYVVDIMVLVGCNDELMVRPSALCLLYVLLCTFFGIASYLAPPLIVTFLVLTYYHRVRQPDVRRQRSSSSSVTK